MILDKSGSVDFYYNDIFGLELGIKYLKQDSKKLKKLGIEDLFYIKNNVCKKTIFYNQFYRMKYFLFTKKL